MLDSGTKVALTDPLLQELVTWREEVDTKPKITPIHVLKDVTATMAKINQEVCHRQHSGCRRLMCVHLQLDALCARTGFETIVFGVRSSSDHYSPPLVHTTSTKIPVFFDLVVKKPVTDIATSMEAFCLSGIDGEFASDATQTAHLY